MWKPSDARIAASELTDFKRHFGAVLGVSFSDHDEFSDATVQNSEQFWNAFWDYFGVIGDKGDKPYLIGSDMISSRFFPKGTLNFAKT